ncbi:hypothetical protein ACLSU7_07475 [Bdellovibrio sp. HCB185ZH]|uniref:hypothetical protein n=1 Tax=Bdellovibrio sp. HCB185ZH TaxID=3394235 RepID=UPI0039A5B8AC
MSKVNLNAHSVLRGGRLWSLLLGSLLTANASLVSAACVVDNDERIELNISPETQSWGDYNGNRLITASRVYKCEQDAGRYLMLSMGATQWSDSTDVKDTYMFDTYQPPNCSINNSKSFAAYTPERTKANFSRQYKFIRSCFDLRVVDVGGAQIIAKEEQDYCKIERTSDGAVILHGDMCFLKIRAQSHFAVQPILKDKCADPEYLRSIGVQAQDIYANINILTTGDDSGYSEDVDNIGSRAMHISITPNSKLLKLSENYGTSVPRFTTSYNINADWGDLKIHTDFENKTEIGLSFFVSNMVNEKCQGGDCSSSSNFTQPFVGQVELFKLSNGRPPKLIEEWWDGGLVPPNWQGFVKGIQYRVPDRVVEVGGRYRMVATFQDPTDDYAIFLNGLRQLLLKMYDVEGATVGIDTLPALSTLSTLGAIPGINGTRVLNQNNQSVDLSETLKGLEEIIASTVWPPYYEFICDNDKCTKFAKRKFHQRLILEFTVGKPDIGDDEVKIQDVRMQKTSPVFDSYPMQKSEFIKLQCGG